MAGAALADPDRIPWQGERMRIVETDDKIKRTFN